MAFEVVLTWASLGVVLSSFGFYLQSARGGAAGGHWFETLLFVMVVALLIFGNLVYHFCRAGYLYRRRRHQAAPDKTLEAVYDTPAPSLSILIPSYREQTGVLLQTVLSVALMEYPHRRVVVLLDDPPNSTGDDLSLLQEARKLVRKLHEEFNKRERLIHCQLLSFMTRLRTGSLDLISENFRAANLYEQIAKWLDEWADRINASSTASTAHTDSHFIEKILRGPANEHRIRAAELSSRPFNAIELTHEYRRLLGLMSVDITSFERKRYANLSHQPNKAMNLNSYIGLLGNSYREIASEDGVHLVECKLDDASLIVPAADYVLTVDADSIILPDYALRLMQIMEQNSKIAVAQTPYSAFPGAPGLIERIAGATTDIQYLVHQGFTWFNASFWVGANAMLRVKALNDICKVVEERGYRLPVFIQDRTVIEDTGSTIDLIQRGWQIYNYPERLAYSATPPDFGSLIIQRRRWSNGGLIILPELIKHQWHTKNIVRCIPEMLIRAHYLISPAVGSLGLLILLLYRFDDGLSSAWLPLTAAPYYLLYGRDLNYTGYRWADLFCVYVLNLLLIPINLAGVFRSLQQAVTGKKAAFGRTPKVQSRTRIPAIHVLLQLLFPIYLAGAFLFDFAKGHYTHAVFAFANCIMLLYGISRFLGWRECFADLCHGVRGPLFLKHQADALNAYLRNRSTLSFKRGRSYAQAELNYPSLAIDVDSLRLRARHFSAVKEYRGQVGR